MDYPLATDDCGRYDCTSFLDDCSVYIYMLRYDPDRRHNQPLSTNVSLTYTEIPRLLNDPLHLIASTWCLFQQEKGTDKTNNGRCVLNNWLDIIPSLPSAHYTDNTTCIHICKKRYTHMYTHTHTHAHTCPCTHTRTPPPPPPTHTHKHIQAQTNYKEFTYFHNFGWDSTIQQLTRHTHEHAHMNRPTHGYNHTHRRTDTHADMYRNTRTHTYIHRQTQTHSHTHTDGHSRIYTQIDKKKVLLSSTCSSTWSTNRLHNIN